MVDVPAEDGKGTVKRSVYEGSGVQPELANSEEAKYTVRIDSELLKQIETEEGESKDEAGKALREIINTVGKPGYLGEHVRCVVSVSMLTEGWDANNVTHILGVRAFASQLLCEQVVGRGLRRMSYMPDPETGLLSPEHVDVYGIPFSLIPFKGRPKDTDGADPVYHHIFAVPERVALEIRVPVVDSYTYDVQGCGITCDVESLEGFVVQDEPMEVYLAPTRGYQDEAVAPSPGEFVQHNRQEFYRTVRFQQVVFQLARLIVEDLVHGAGGAGANDLRKAALAKHQLFPEVVQIVQQYVNRKVNFAPGVDRRELALERYAKLLRDRVRDGILPQVAGTRLLPIVNSYHRVNSTADVNYRTTRPVVQLTKSHLNLASIRSDWEREAIAVLEDLDFVEAFAPNDRSIGFWVPYTYNDTSALYEPDFIVRLRGGRLVMLEIKGRGGEIHDEDRVLAKNVAAKKWVAAVNSAGQYGQWVFEICKEVSKLRSVLGSHVEGGVVLPFRSVQPPPEERFRTCVPLVSLRAAAGTWSQEQLGLEESGEWADDWVTYETDALRSFRDLLRKRTAWSHHDLEALFDRVKLERTQHTRQPIPYAEYLKLLWQVPLECASCHRRPPDVKLPSTISSQRPGGSPVTPTCASRSTGNTCRSGTSRRSTRCCERRAGASPPISRGSSRAA
jgi:type III restriction enzyme